MAGRQADGCQLGTLDMANIGLSLTRTCLKNRCHSRMSLSGVQKALSGLPPKACGNDTGERNAIFETTSNDYLSMNSFRFQQIENCQCRSLLAPHALSGGANPLGCVLK
jgi:hypothetical protein